MPLSFTIALRNIMTKRDNRFISFVAFVATFGLILGVAALITVLSVLNGFEVALKERLLGVIPHVQIYAPQMVKDWQPMTQTLASADPNIAKVAPSLNTQVMAVSHQANKTQVLTLMGVDATYEKDISLLAQDSKDGQGVIQGSLDSVHAGNNIIVGEWLAEEFGLKLGDDLMIVLPKGANTPSGISPVSHRFVVSGIFKLTNQTEKYLAVASIDSVARALEVEGAGVGGFKLKLNDVFSADKTAEHLKQSYPQLTIHHWINTHGSIYETLKMQRNMMAILLLLIVMVAGFNLVSSLVMTVTEKKSDIAILKTMGAAPSFIQAVFFWQGFLIALMGTLIGVLLGLLLAYNIGALSSWVNDTFELNLFDRYFVTELPSDIRLWNVSLVAVASIAIGVLATFYPAKKAAKTDPATALRYD